MKKRPTLVVQGSDITGRRIYKVYRLNVFLRWNRVLLYDIESIPYWAVFPDKASACSFAEREGRWLYLERESLMHGLHGIDVLYEKFCK